MCVLAATAATALAVAPTASAALNLEPIGESFDEPTFVTSPPGDANALFVTERSGDIKKVEAGTVSVFLDLQDRIEYVRNDFCCFEKGLLSMAFAPDYSQSHAFYVDYIRQKSAAETSGDIRVEEFKTNEAGEAIPESGRPVLTIPHPTIHHFGGQLEFGPEGDLYISVGDGSVNVEPASIEEPQNLNSLLGKILRIDPHESEGQPYTIPAGNPFAGEAERRAEIWAYGFRNPWRFSFDAENGALTVGDVGNSEREEIDYVLPEGGNPAGRGLNFGWPCREGLMASNFGPTAEDGCPLAEGTYTEPIFDYEHVPIDGSPQSACAIMGGYVAHDPSLGEADGRYIYADLCTGQVRSIGLDGKGDRLETTVPIPAGKTSGSPESLGQDSCGRIYVATALGFVYRLSGPTATDCTPPVLATTVPPGPANDNSPVISGSAPPGSAVRIFTTPDCTGPPVAEGSAEELEGTGIALSVADDSNTSFRASANYSSDCSAPLTYVEDSTPPDTSITDQPPATTTETTASFSFESSEAGSSFECSLDGGAWVSCTSPKTYSSLSAGAHTFEVRATDAAGNVDPTPARVSFRVETVVPPQSLPAGSGLPIPPAGSGAAALQTEVTLALRRAPGADGSRALLRAGVSPCAGREGGAIELLRANKVILHAHLSPTCHATFRVRGAASARFRALVPPLGSYLAGASAPIRVPLAAVPPSR